MTLVSPLAAALAELSASVPVTTITTRIRPVEPAAGDALGPGAYIPFVVVTVLDAPPMPHMGIRSVTLGLRCYAATWPLAEALWLACEGTFRDRGARLGANRIGIHHSTVTSGGTPEKDPVTLQPIVYGIVEYPTSIAAIPA